MSHPNNNNNTPSTKPMAIPVSQMRHSRTRSASMSSASSSSPDEIPTPISSFPTNHIRSNSASSPILSYFLSNPSPTSTLKSKFSGTAPVFEEPEEDYESTPQKAAPSMPSSMSLNNSIGRRGSLAAPRFPPVSPTVPPSTSPPSTERGAGLLRRLSLGSAAFSGIPPPSKSPTAAPPNTAVEGSMPYATPISTSPPDPATATRRTRRRATVSTSARRAPSPMGERILKGHFDGFN